MAVQSRLMDFVRISEQHLNASPRHRLILTPQGGLRAEPLSRFSFSTPLNAQAENRAVWAAFLRVLTEHLGPAKVERIASRYRMSFQRFQENGDPLLPELVEKVTIGATRTLSTDLKKARSERLKRMRTEEIGLRFEQKNCPIVGDPMNPFIVYGGPSQRRAWVMHNPQLMDKELHFLSTKIDNLSFGAWRERLCKSMINKELMEKQILPAPGRGGRVEYYKVYKKIAGHGLVAYALKPVGADSTLSPLVVFRPTQVAPSYEDMIDSVMNDFQLRIGEMGYLPAKPALDDLMSDPHFCPKGKRVAVAGYSLGGIHAQWFTFDHWRKISKATFFNAPSVHEEMAEEFARQVNSAQRPALKLRIKRVTAGNQPDWAHIVGGKHLGWGIKHRRIVKLQEYNCDFRPISSLFDRIWLHTRRVIDNQELKFCAKIVDPELLNQHLDNESRGPEIYWFEKTRRVWGVFLFYSLLWFKNSLKMIQRCTGIPLLRSALPST